jgi:hypothetical protein
VSEPPPCRRKTGGAGCGCQTGGVVLEEVGVLGSVAMSIGDSVLGF